MHIKLVKAKPFQGLISYLIQTSLKDNEYTIKMASFTWLISERKILHLVSVFGFSLKICPVTQLLLLQTVCLENGL